MSRMVIMDLLICPICSNKNWVFFWQQEQVDAFRCMDCKSSIQEMEVHLKNENDDKNIRFSDQHAGDSVCGTEPTEVINSDRSGSGCTNSYEDGSTGELSESDLPIGEGCPVVSGVDGEGEK